MTGAEMLKFRSLIRRFQSPSASWVTLGISLVFTTLAWKISSDSMHDQMSLKFGFGVDEIQHKITQRLQAQEQVLRGVSAYASMVAQPQPAHWKNYVLAQHLEHQGLGIEGLGFVQVSSKSARDTYTSILYLEDFALRTAESFKSIVYTSVGSDNDTSFRMRDLSDGKEKFVIYVPVFTAGVPLESLLDRQRALVGWVFSPFIFDELLESLNSVRNQIDFTIYDGNGTQDREIYRQRNAIDSRKNQFNMVQKQRLVYGGMAWSVHYSSNRNLFSDSNMSSLVAVGGLVVNLILFFIVTAYARQKTEIEREVTLRSGQLKVLFELSPDGFVILRRSSSDSGEQTLVEYVNPAFEQLTGLLLDDVVGVADHSLQTLIAERCTNPSEGKLTNTDLYHLVFPQRRTLVGTKQENSSHAFLCYRDVTREVEVDRMKTEFLSTAAHELRTPMASILGFTELLMHRSYDEQRQKRMFEKIHRQGTILVHMINDLLDLSRIEARQGKGFVFGSHPLGELVSRASEIISMNDSRPVSLDPRLADHSIHADSEQSHRAFLNVLSNAYKYSPAGSEVKVELVMSGGPKDCVGVKVIDLGVGMKPEHVERVFERFFRADQSGKIPGTGLGMALTKEIVELQGGRIDVQSSFGAGTAFTLWFRLAEKLALPAVPAHSG